LEPGGITDLDVYLAVLAVILDVYGWADGGGDIWECCDEAKVWSANLKTQLSSVGVNIPAVASLFETDFTALCTSGSTISNALDCHFTEI